MLSGGALQGCDWESVAEEQSTVNEIKNIFYELAAGFTIMNLIYFTKMRTIIKIFYLYWNLFSSQKSK